MKNLLIPWINIVFVSGLFSERISIECGVPQGSILGPFLFLLYINDLYSVFNKAIRIHFTDDTHSRCASEKLSTVEFVTNDELKKLRDQT